MLTSKPILKFVVYFALTIGILLSAFPLIREKSGMYMVNIGNKFLHSPIENSYVTFHKLKERFDVEVRVGNFTQLVNNTVPSYNEKFDSYYFTYLPLALLIALIVASPVSIKRKLFSFAIGAIFLNFLLIFKLYIKIRYLSLSHSSLGFTVPSPLIKKSIDLLNYTFVDSGTIILFIVVFIWLAFTFRIEDLSLIRPEYNKKIKIGKN